MKRSFRLFSLFSISITVIISVLIYYIYYSLLKSPMEINLSLGLLIIDIALIYRIIHNINTHKSNKKYLQVNLKKFLCEFYLVQFLTCDIILLIGSKLLHYFVNIIFPISNCSFHSLIYNISIDNNTYIINLFDIIIQPIVIICTIIMISMVVISILWLVISNHINKKGIDIQSHKN